LDEFHLTLHHFPYTFRWFLHTFSSLNSPQFLLILTHLLHLTLNTHGQFCPPLLLIQATPTYSHPKGGRKCVVASGGKAKAYRKVQVSDLLHAGISAYSQTAAVHFVRHLREPFQS
jgi:hypothetical protein